MKKEDLIRGRWYIGEGRFIGGIALWNGREFMGIQGKWGRYVQTWAVYGERGFSPEKELVL